MLSRNRFISTAAAVTLASGLSLAAAGAAPSAFASDNCAAYGSQCPTVTPTTVKPDVKGTTLTKQPASLPFTGGEFALLATAGAVALGGGTALVVASRRRRTAA
jgi:hypothetical protein